LISLPLNYLIAIIVAGGWFVTVINLAYPVRWLIGMGGSTADAWGGPSFAGAWAFHAVFGGLTLLFVMTWLVSGLTRLQTRLLSGMLLR
jgi:hypothetical protein